MSGRACASSPSLRQLEAAASERSRRHAAGQGVPLRSRRRSSTSSTPPSAPIRSTAATRRWRSTDRRGRRDARADPAASATPSSKARGCCWRGGLAALRSEQEQADIAGLLVHGRRLRLPDRRHRHHRARRRATGDARSASLPARTQPAADDPREPARPDLRDRRRGHGRGLERGLRASSRPGTRRKSAPPDAGSAAVGPLAGDAGAAPAAATSVERAESRSLTARVSHDGRDYEVSRGEMSGGGAVVRCVDITEKLRDEAALRQGQKMEATGQLTGGMAHDFNNILQVIRANLDLHEGRRRRPIPRCCGALQSATAAADRGARLTQQLLAFARRQPLAPQPTERRPAGVGSRRPAAPFAGRAHHHRARRSPTIPGMPGSIPASSRTPSSILRSMRATPCRTAARCGSRCRTPRSIGAMRRFIPT